MSLIKYRTFSSSARIDPVKITRETASSIFTSHNGAPERRAAKVSSYDRYHDTWKDAHAHLLKQAELSIESIRRNLEAAHGKLGNIKGMKPPKDSQ